LTCAYSFGFFGFGDFGFDGFRGITVLLAFAPLWCHAPRAKGESGGCDLFWSREMTDQNHLGTIFSCFNVPALFFAFAILFHFDTFFF
jgi:hypothetical protein